MKDNEAAHRASRAPRADQPGNRRGEAKCARRRCRPAAREPLPQTGRKGEDPDSRTGSPGRSLGERGDRVGFVSGFPGPAPGPGLPALVFTGIA